MTGAPYRRPWLSGVGALLAAAIGSVGARGPCALCRASTPIGDLRPIAPGAVGLLVCPLCQRVATPPGPDPLH